MPMQLNAEVLGSSSTMLTVRKLTAVDDTNRSGLEMEQD